MSNTLTDYQKQAIAEIARHPDYSFNIKAKLYKFGKGNKKTLSLLDCAKYLANGIGFSEELGPIAVEYLNEQITEHIAENMDDTTDRPSISEWEAGGAYPEYLKHIEFANLLFSTLEVVPSGSWVYPAEGIPWWIKEINKSVKVGEPVKLHDIGAGIAEEQRRWHMLRTTNEKETKYTLTMDGLRECIPSVQSNMKKTTIRKLARHLKYNPDIKKNVQLNKFLKSYVAMGERKLHKIMIRHWVWNVKRRLLGLPTRFEIILVFLGRQGVGKSYIQSCLNKALPYLVTNATIQQTEDERESPKWENHYIAFFDEISKEKKEALAKFKSWISASTLEYRPMRTNSVEVCEKNAQGLATTNFPISQLLRDTSGMRRMWEIASDQPKGILFEGMDKVDWVEIFRTVDEDLETGYLVPGTEEYIEISKIQDESRDQSPVELFLVEKDCLDPSGSLNHDTDLIMQPMKELREMFNIWADDMGWGRGYTPKAFKENIVNLGLKIEKGRGNALYIELNDPKKMRLKMKEKMKEKDYSDGLINMDDFDESLISGDK